MFLLGGVDLALIGLCALVYLVRRRSQLARTATGP
jgi:hypothetical protein